MYRNTSSITFDNFFNILENMQGARLRGFIANFCLSKYAILTSEHLLVRSNEFHFDEKYFVNRLNKTSLHRFVQKNFFFIFQVPLKIVQILQIHTIVENNKSFLCYKNWVNFLP